MCFVVKHSAPTAAARGPFGYYDPGEQFYDEAFGEPGVARSHYAELLAGLEGADLEALRRQVCTELQQSGVSFGGAGGTTPFAVDPIPRIIPVEEWRQVEAGAVQRVRALNAFIADAYGERRMVAAGRIPGRAVERADHHEPHMRDVPVPGGVYAHVAGLDLVRGPDGRFQVLEDNLRTPSGLTYALAAREMTDGRLPVSPPAARRSLDSMLEVLGAALRAAAPDGRGDPSVVLLSDGPSNSAWYEHRELGRLLEIPIVGLGDLSVHAGALHARLSDSAPARRVDVLYRRTDIDGLTGADGKPTEIGAALLEPCRRGRLACVNAFGAGVADDKLVHAYVEEMIRFYLDEQPILRSVPTYDLQNHAVRERALARLEHLVVKPRTGHGGFGIVICAHATAVDRHRVAGRIRADPDRYVVQETVGLSTHPTVAGNSLAPRHVDLRPFVITVGDDVHVVPGGLTRVAFDEGALVVNSSQNGGGKDTWVLGR